jgi:hypothetical protein
MITLKPDYADYKARLHRLNFFLSFLPLVYAIIIAPGLAGASDLKSLPILPSSEVIWQDKNLMVNGMAARSMHLRSDMPAKEAIAFYREALVQAQWALKEDYPVQGTLVLTKDDEFLYVVVVNNGEGQPCDVYLASSPTSLAVCYVIKDYLMKENIAPDVAGKDFPDLPRYPGSKRRINVFTPMEAAVVMYEAQAKPQEIAKFYRSNLRDLGWKEERQLSPERFVRLAPQVGDKISVLLYSRDDNRDTLVIYITAAPEGLCANAKISQRSIIMVTRNIKEELVYPQKEGEGL